MPITLILVVAVCNGGTACHTTSGNWEGAGMISQILQININVT